MATAKKATAKKAVRKNAAPKTRKAIVKETADKAVNIYLGLVGKGLDVVQDNIESARKDSKKQVSLLEKRGVKLRKALTTRIKGVDKDAKRQLNKAQNRVEKVQKSVEDAVEDVIDATKGKRTTAPKRKTTARKAA